MSEQPVNGSQLKTLAVRLTEGLRVQLDILARLDGRSTTAYITAILQGHVDKAKSDPEILKRAKEVQEKMQREAQAQQDAIASIFGGSAAPEGAETAGQKDGAAPQGEDASSKGASEASTSSRPSARRGSKPAGE